MIRILGNFLWTKFVKNVDWTNFPPFCFRATNSVQASFTSTREFSQLTKWRRKGSVTLFASKRVFALLEFKKVMAQIWFFWDLYKHWNYFLSSVATEEKDGYELKLEKIGLTFSSFNGMPVKVTPPKILWLALPDGICLIYFSWLFWSVFFFLINLYLGASNLAERV